MLCKGQVGLPSPGAARGLGKAVPRPRDAPRGRGGCYSPEPSGPQARDCGQGQAPLSLECSASTKHIASVAKPFAPALSRP